ncbi:MAG: RNA-binding cell elongation regulator Jag/EloR [Anaerolineaceae bacterium]
MSNTHEFMAATIEEAVAKGLDELGLNRNEVEVEVLDEGKRNVFKFASRQAHIRLIPRKQPLVSDDTVPEEPTPLQVLSDDEVALEFAGELTDASDSAGSVREVLTGILEKMEIKANVTTKMIHSDEDDRDIVYANIEGDDLSFLIGRKSETLNALQYLTGLIISKKFNHWVPIQVDVQSYRDRRESELKKIAHRMAEQAITTGRKQFLEPMPANERRIIHMELRNYEQLVSESIGEDPNRKVTIVLKK